MSKKVLVIGWDAADWKVIAPLADAGKMPNLKKFVDEGVMGNLATLTPILSPMLWTSIATGKRAYKHGVHGFIEPDFNTGNVRPITNLARQTKAIWNILNQEGKKSNVIGWWPTYPVEPINGVMVCDHYQDAHHNDPDKPWPLKPKSIHPERLIKPLSELRVHPGEIEGEQIEMFVPKAREIDQEKDKRLWSLAKIIAETASIHAAATATMQLETWDFMGIYYDAIDHFCHGFMKYHPPRSPWISEDDFNLYSEVVNSAYQYHDAMLGVLLKLAGDDTNVIIVSDHGFHPDRLRPQHIPTEPAGPAEEHRPYGMIAMRGPDIKEDEVIHGATLLDVTPTILTLFGLPVGKDMDGKVLANAFREPPKISYIDSWDEVEGSDAMHPEDARVDSMDSAEAMQQLVDLGYVQEMSEDKDQRIKETLRELQYNLAQSYTGAGRYRDAIPILEELWETWSDESRFGVQLFNAHLALDCVPEARETFEKLRDRKQAYRKQAQEALKQLQDTLKEKKPEEITKQEQRELRNLRAKAGVNPTALAFLQGSLLFAEKRYEEALESLEKAKSAQTHNLPSLYQKMGEVHLAMGNWLEAESYFNQVLELDPVNPAPMLGLSRLCLKLNRNEEARDRAVAALGLKYHHPKAHYLCGAALHRLGETEAAIQSLKTAIAQNPVFPAAHRRLSYIYTRDLNDPDKAADCRRLARESRQRIKDFQAGNIPATETYAGVMEWYDKQQKGDHTVKELNVPVSDSVVIVSGLPRSGTSMMMQMLAAGGFPIVTDGEREADQSNPRGYYELEKVKALNTDNSWLNEVKGQSVKIIAQLLPKLPRNIPYRIIFMERHLAEVISSQKNMLGRLGRKGARVSDDRLAQTFMRQLESVDRMLEAYPEISVLSVSHRDAIENPVSVAAKVNAFLGGNLDESSMIKAVDRSLYREQKPS